MINSDEIARLLTEHAFVYEHRCACGHFEGWEGDSWENWVAHIAAVAKSTDS